MEVDVWDGPSGEPVVYHGHTLTSRILFKEVVATLAQYAFQVGAPVGNTVRQEDLRKKWLRLGLERVKGQGEVRSNGIW